ncbi:MAG: tRNA-intron lyase [Candidatus Methanoplasma sp.]|jgi:tRNA-intron endonuclease|nr:tRNA-intron lyase [Candidatus Methanoplasma sp.]
MNTLLLTQMSGELFEDTVVIGDPKEGTQLYNKGNFGYPMRGGGLELDLIEATFLTECERLQVTKDGSPVSFREMFCYSSEQYDGFGTSYLVYRDMRNRGFVVKAESGHFDLSVFPRGYTMSNSRPQYLVRAVSERDVLDLDVFSKEVSHTEGRGKKLLYGVADEEGDITYYHMSAKDPCGRSFHLPSGHRARGYLIGGRVLVFDESQTERLRGKAFYGKMMGSVLHLSLIECCFLSETGDLEVVSQSGEIMSAEETVDLGMKTQEEFDLRLDAFRDLRRRGMVVKTGFKYGAHFRVYEGTPDDDHAKYLVHAVPSGKTMTWPEISRTVRLSGGVKKEILFCRTGEPMEYLEFKWFRP